MPRPPRGQRIPARRTTDASARPAHRRLDGRRWPVEAGGQPSTRGHRAQPVYRRPVDRVRRRHLQRGDQPVRRHHDHRGGRRDRRTGRGRDRRRPASLRHHRLVAHADRRARRAARFGRRPDRPRPRRDGPRGDPQHRQGDAREPLGHGRRRTRLPLLRRPGGQGGRPPGRRRQPERASVASSTSRSACAGSSGRGTTRCSR